MRRKPQLTPRKQPKQQRSRQMQADILAAAIRVLEREGALRFTTSRVAAAAGISVGSLYQYFPNKQSLVFALHSQAVQRAWLEVQQILEHHAWSPREKLRRVAAMFFFEESAEVARMGAALQEAEVFFADQPEQRALDAQVLARFTRFVRDALPHTSASRAAFLAGLLVVTLENVGRAVASMKLRRREIHRWSNNCAEMLANHLGLQ